MSTDATNAPDAGPNQHSGSSFTRICSYIAGHRMEAALCASRIFTAVCSVLFVLPLMGSSTSFYQRALIASAITSALRLHQRLPNVQFSRQFLSRVVTEDSAHYLMYAVIFITSYPLTPVIVPVFLFAALHSGSWLRTLLIGSGVASNNSLVALLSKLSAKQVEILRFIAIMEIAIFPITLFTLFSGQGSLLTPFIYYRFVTLRYSSQRNPYCRQIFHEYRLATEYLASHQKCPGVVRSLLYKLVAFLSRLSPVPQTQQ